MHRNSFWAGQGRLSTYKESYSDSAHSDAKILGESVDRGECPPRLELESAESFWSSLAYRWCSCDGTRNSFAIQRSICACSPRRSHRCLRARTRARSCTSYTIWIVTHNLTRIFQTKCWDLSSIQICLLQLSGLAGILARKRVWRPTPSRFGSCMNRPGDSSRKFKHACSCNGTSFGRFADSGCR